MSAPANTYLEYLQEEGYRPSIDDDGDVMFKHEGRTFWILVDDDDERYFSLIYPNFWEIESDEELARAALAASAASRDTKVAKVYLRSDRTNVVAAVELYLPAPGDFAAIFPRAVRSLVTAIGTFTSSMRES